MPPEFNAGYLVGQFLLAKNESLIPSGWFRERAGSWCLGRHPSLPMVRLTGGGGTPVGWILGYPVGGDGVLRADGDEAAVPWNRGGADALIEDFVYGFGGRFIAVLLEPPGPRIYLDPIGSLSMVYCAHQEIAASTPNLIPPDEDTREHADLVRGIGIPETNAMYPLGLTPRRNVERLLPNHYLDLDSWKAVRHWPSRALAADGSPEEAVAAVPAIAKRQIAAVLARVPAYLCQTAGQDSRMLLACAKDVADRLTLFTVPMPDDDAVIDVDVARRISRRFRLRHFVPTRRKSSREELDEYMYRIGYSTGEVRGWRYASMFWQGDPAYAQFDGGVGGLERNLGIPDDVTETTEIMPERLVDYCLAPRLPETLGRCRQWLDTVPAENAYQVMDLFAIEQRFGCWQGVWPYAQQGNPGFLFFPLNHREVLGRITALPMEYRASGVMMTEIIRREWPELLAWPFNEPLGLTKVRIAAREGGRSAVRGLRSARTGLETQARRLGKAVSNPGWAMRRLWERLSGAGEEADGSLR